MPPVSIKYASHLLLGKRVRIKAATFKGISLHFRVKNSCKPWRIKASGPWRVCVDYLLASDE
jgi:hypothetical protein